MSAQVTTLARVEDMYATAVAWRYDTDGRPDLQRMQEAQRAEFQAAIAQAKADAWDEGYFARMDDYPFDPEERANPYRSEETQE